MPPGKKAASKTPMADYDDGCRVTSISTSSPITTSRRSSSPLISRPANASASRHRSRPSTPNLEKTSKSVSLDPVALHPGIHAGAILLGSAFGFLGLLWSGLIVYVGLTARAEFAPMDVLTCQAA